MGGTAMLYAAPRGAPLASKSCAVAGEVALVSQTIVNPPLASGCDAIWGDHDAIAEKLLAYVDEGISHLQVVLAPATPKSLEAFAPVLEVIDRAGR